MTRRAGIEAVAGVLCVALAVVAFLTARDVWRVDGALRSADARARVTEPDPRAWSAETTVPFDLAHALLRVEDDLEFRELLARGRTMTGRTPDDERSRPYLAAKAELAHVAQRADPIRSSHAANLLGVLELTEPDEPERTSLEQALERFVRAVELDPANDVAKTNLELMLRFVDDETSRRGRAGGGDAAGSGAGLQAPGSGW